MPKLTTIGGSLVRMRTMEWMNPKIMPNRIETNKKRKMLLTVAMSGTIREAKRQAKMPVAPKEKSIRPELRLVFKAKAAMRVMSMDFAMIMMLAMLSLLEPMMKRPVPLMLDKRIATRSITTGQRRDQKSFFPMLFSLRLAKNGLFEY